MNPLLIGPLAELIKSVINKIWPDPAAQADAQLKVMQLVQTGELAQLAADTGLMQSQIDVNKVEAQSESLFKSGWRPFIGWVCGSSFAWNFAIAPGATWALNAAQSIGVYHGTVVQFGAADLSQMMPVLMGLLGLGVMRSAEKILGTK